MNFSSHIPEQTQQSFASSGLLTAHLPALQSTPGGLSLRSCKHSPGALCSSSISTCQMNHLRLLQGIPCPLLQPVLVCRAVPTPCGSSLPLLFLLGCMLSVAASISPILQREQRGGRVSWVLQRLPWPFLTPMKSPRLPSPPSQGARCF